MRWGLGEELLPSDQLLELQGVAPLIEGRLGSNRSQGITLRAQARLAPQVRVHTFTQVTGSSLLWGATPHGGQGGRVEWLLAI